jgi:hypothetical protein
MHNLNYMHIDFIYRQFSMNTNKDMIYAYQWNSFLAFSQKCGYKGVALTQRYSAALVRTFVYVPSRFGFRRITQEHLLTRGSFLSKTSATQNPRWPPATYTSSRFPSNNSRINTCSDLSSWMISQIRIQITQATACHHNHMYFPFIF